MQMIDLYYSYPALLNKLEVVEMELFKDDDAFEPLLSRFVYGAAQYRSMARTYD